MTVYILNSPILTNFGEYRYEPISVEKARAILFGGEFVSAIGHESTAKFLSKLLGVAIPANRVAVKMEAGDKAIVFKIKQRLSEGIVLTEQELSKYEYELGLLTKTK